MKVLFTTLREKSHFLAMVPFVEAFRRTGHDVAVAAPEDLAERVAEAGVRFFPMGHPGTEGLRPLNERIGKAPRDQVTRMVMSELFAGACAGAAIPSVVEMLESFRPAVLLRESHEFAGLVAAEKVGVPHVRVAICAQGAEAEIRGYAAASVDAHLRAIGLPSDPEASRIRDEEAVTLFPPSFEPPETATARVHRFRLPQREAPPLPDWWGTQPGPFVYVTFGTVAGSFDMLRAKYREILDALDGAPVRALLTIGASLPFDALGAVPSNVHVERFVPQHEVLPHAAAVVCHGGSGTVHGALAAGAPLVVTPMFADQPYNAERIAAVGAGLATRQLEASPEAVRAAILRVVEEPSFRDVAQRFSREIASLPLVDEAARALEAIAARPRH